MRGIEGALVALQNTREGRFIGESIRALGEKVPLKELSLASSLAYVAVRREALWRTVFGAYVNKKASGKPQKLAPLVSDVLLLGTAGILELRHFARAVLVNGLLEILKGGGQEKAVPMVNAILHNVARDGADTLEKLRRSPKQEERALWAGVPEWTVPAWKKSWGNEDLNALFEMMQLPPQAALRARPGGREALLALLVAQGLEVSPSDLYPGAIRLASTILPSLVPGFQEGEATVQTEGSMLAASLVSAFWKGGAVLDMCSGRGVKAGQIALDLPQARLECWELSSGKHLAAAKEMRRLGVEGRVNLRVGDARTLEPMERPHLVFLDAPCSGSGTWNRKPESKWKLNWLKLDAVCETQKILLRRALTLAASGGIIVYVTCSLLRQENENVVAQVLAEHSDCVALSVPWAPSPHLRQGRPWGMYILPVLPWLDGFYVSVIMKRAGA